MRDDRPVLIEKTGKGLKGLMVLGVLAALAGFALLWANRADAEANNLPGWALLLGGAFVFCVSRIGAWWSHG